MWQFMDFRAREFGMRVDAKRASTIAPTC